MVKIKFSRRQVALVAGVVLLAGAVALTVYGLFELRGLRARMHSVEYANGESIRQQAELEKAIAAEKVDQEVLSKTTKTVRVDNNYYNKDYSDPDTPEATYEEVKVIEYRVKITNNTTFAYDTYSADIRGKTKSGSLISPLDFSTIHEDDTAGEGALSLAPGGVGEIYIYMPADQGVEDLYFGYSGI